MPSKRKPQEKWKKTEERNTTSAKPPASNKRRVRIPKDPWTEEEVSRRSRNNEFFRELDKLNYGPWW
jgi:hypothetical protein